MNKTKVTMQIGNYVLWFRGKRVVVKGRSSVGPYGFRVLHGLSPDYDVSKAETIATFDLKQAEKVAAMLEPSEIGSFPLRKSGKNAVRVGCTKVTREEVNAVLKLIKK